MCAGLSWRYHIPAVRIGTALTDGRCAELLAEFSRGQLLISGCSCDLQVRLTLTQAALPTWQLSPLDPGHDLMENGGISHQTLS